MIFVENDYGFEYIEVVGVTTFHLTLFALALLSIRPEGDDWKRMRLPATDEAMMAERERLGGKDGVGKLILEEIDGKEVAWIKNKYPYDGLFPQGIELVHECFYKTTAPLSREEMVMAAQKRYHEQSILIFKNGVQRKSIQSIDHAHAITQRGCQ